jgi:signal peptidase I
MVLVFVIIGLIIIYFSVNRWVIRMGEVKGRSMEPTLHDKDLIFIKLLYRNPKKGDVVVLEDNDGYTVVKRVALVPGDLDDVSPRPTVLLHQDEYVVLGDNPNESSDSRHYGPVNRKQLIGIVIR